MEFKQLIYNINTCQLCTLSKTRTTPVPGEGSRHPELMFIGEGPGYHEDMEGRPFVGQSGKFLQLMLQSIQLDRNDVYITNMVKCRPPNNRDPMPGELAACRGFLDTQIELLDPRILVTLGRFSFSKFFPASQLSNSRGKIHRWDTRLVYPIYHPAAALHNPKLRPVIENDFRRLSIILKELSLPIQDPSERLLSKAQQLALFDTFQ